MSPNVGLRFAHADNRHQHPQALLAAPSRFEQPLKAWYDEARHATWSAPQDSWDGSCDHTHALALETERTLRFNRVWNSLIDHSL